MGWIARVFAYLRFGDPSYADVPVGGLVIEFASGFLPHGRCIMTTLRSPDSQSGTLTIRSRSHYAAPPDVDCVLTLTGERFAKYAQFLAADDLEPCLAPVTDGWRTRIRGYAAGRGWTKQYVIGGDNRFALQAVRLQEIIDTLLADGRQGQAVQGVACSPPTAS